MVVLACYRAIQRRLGRLALLPAWLVVATSHLVPAQGVTTATISGRVSPGDAVVRVVNDATGFQVEVQARGGRFSAQGLEPGGPYRIAIRRVGFTPHEQRGVYLTLGQRFELGVQLASAATSLDTLRIERRERESHIATTVSDSLLHRLPSLNRDMFDFVRLAPQISTKIGIGGGGISGGGVNLRFNNFLIDGAPDRFPTGNSATAFGGGKSVPMEAVKEYQVLLTPFDVRFGDFAGALVNSVTRGGTNAFHASAFAYERSDDLARSGSGRAVPYQRTQFGFSAAGRLVRDRAHFFIAPEVQRLTSPSRGPFLGQASIPVNAADIARFSTIMNGYGLDAGSGGAVTTESPSMTLFSRVDVELSAIQSRAVLLDNYQRTANSQFSRAVIDTFALSSYRVTQAFATHLTSAQLHTTVRGGGYNALTVSHRSNWSENRPDVREPVVLVPIPSPGGGTTILKAGSQETGHGIFTHQVSIGLTDNFAVQAGDAHLLAFGATTELFRLTKGGVNASYGTWTFASLSAFESGIADRYEVKRDFGSTGVPMHGAEYAIYAGDEWRAGDRLSVTFGARADALILPDHAPYVAAIDSLFGRRSDRMPRSRVHISPRVGFNWDLYGTGRDQIRGGAGIFTGRYPPAWAFVAFYSYGRGIGSLQCGTMPNDLGPPPAFIPDYRTPPSACANGKGFGTTPRGDVDLLDRNLRMAQTARASLAYERRLARDATLTAEAMITRNISDFMFVNLNLVGAQATDRQGRVMYGRLTASGIDTTARVSDFSEVIDLKNTSANHAFQVDARLDKRFSHRLAATASYTFSRVRDVGLALRSGMPGIVNWTSERVVSGRHDRWPTGVSLYDLPHRVVVAVTSAIPWRRRTTDVSLYYVGESGSPFTYVASGVGKRGDLNADGQAGNDPVFIPRSASDTTEMRFSGVSDGAGADNSPDAVARRIASQQQAFDRFIDATPCLRRQRGQIMRRNSCREPWSHTSIVSIRQTLPVAAAHALALHLDVFNVLNLLNARWGRYRVAVDPTLSTLPSLLSQVSPNVAQPVFRFDATRPRWATLATESSYQLQVGVRYRF